ncbi:alpha/beta-hydrolase [Epithele typhae]|uniref:alpha/beta-hydrolase n=1 Tax=Epithele typhae TaxID=378194 RepID=UPI002008C3D8|nr:alpha/beta-hydrolase [Epithele typhae]KAH9946056.1 alpha/beta-hydrolase [Epithele typhae]
MSKPRLTHRQPFKGFYVVYLAVSYTLVRLPLWCIKYSPKKNRPRSSWTLKRYITVATYRELNLSTSHPFPTSDKELKNAKFLFIDGIGSASDAFCGEVQRAAQITGVTPDSGPGTDIPPTLAQPGERVALHIHGGAFFLGSAHPDAPTSQLSHGILDHSSTLLRIMVVDYRLATASPNPPGNHFPAALLDSIAAYQYLTKDVGFLPQNITLVGDSAGGNIAFALVRHILENPGAGLPLPGRLLSCSSFLDVSLSRQEPGSSIYRNHGNDILGVDDRYMHDAYLGPLGIEEAKRNPYISPVSPHIKNHEGLFKGFPRTFISAGEAESILDDSVIVAERLKADGVDVVCDIVLDATHDFAMFPWHEPERTPALKRMCAWLDD